MYNIKTGLYDGFEFVTYFWDKHDWAFWKSVTASGDLDGYEMGKDENEDCG